MTDSIFTFIAAAQTLFAQLFYFYGLPELSICFMIPKSFIFICVREKRPAVPTHCLTHRDHLFSDSQLKKAPTAGSTVKKQLKQINKILLTSRDESYELFSLRGMMKEPRKN